MDKPARCHTASQAPSSGQTGSGDPWARLLSQKEQKWGVGAGGPDLLGAEMGAGHVLDPRDPGLTGHGWEVDADQHGEVGHDVGEHVGQPTGTGLLRHGH